jgi:glutamine amidotransferase
MGNIGSVRRSLEECGGNVLVSDEPNSLAKADKIILPGVGAFGDGMQHLCKKGWPQALKEAVSTDGKKLLGICLGMQLLAECSYEGGEKHDGLGFIPGSVELFEPLASERVPHVGWNEVEQRKRHALFSEIPDGTDFYFVHSYHFVTDSQYSLATTPYCESFVSVVGKGNILGVQFHPEKSSKSGLQLLKNFIEI